MRRERNFIDETRLSVERTTEGRRRVTSHNQRSGVTARGGDSASHVVRRPALTRNRLACGHEPNIGTTPSWPTSRSAPARYSAPGASRSNRSLVVDVERNGPSRRSDRTRGSRRRAQQKSRVPACGPASSSVLAVARSPICPAGSGTDTSRRPGPPPLQPCRNARDQGHNSQAGDDCPLQRAIAVIGIPSGEKLDPLSRDQGQDGENCCPSAQAGFEPKPLALTSGPTYLPTLLDQDFVSG